MTALRSEEKWILQLVASRVKEARERAKLNRLQVIEKSGVGKTAYYGLETGEVNMTIGTLARVLKVLDVGFDELFRSDGNAQPGGAKPDSATVAQLQDSATKATLQVASLTDKLSELRVTTDKLLALVDDLTNTSSHPNGSHNGPEAPR